MAHDMTTLADSLGGSQAAKDYFSNLKAKLDISSTNLQKVASEELAEFTVSISWSFF